MESDAILIFGKMLLTFGVLLGVPLRELWRLRHVETDCLRSLGAGGGRAD